MTDNTLRSLEREASLGSPEARDRHLVALHRAGRSSIIPTGEGLYLHEKTGIGMVYVPGGEIEGPLERLPGPGNAHVYRPPQVIAPFFLGRFPVTNEQWERFWIYRPTNEPDRGYPLETRRDRLHHPAVNVKHADALSFCSWSGLRLPSAREWRWAAMGGEAQRVPCEACEVRPTREVAEPRSVEIQIRSRGLPVDRQWSVITFVPFADFSAERFALEVRGLRAKARARGHCQCDDNGLVDRRYPWGNEDPTPDHCVWAGGGGQGLEGVRTILVVAGSHWSARHLIRTWPDRALAALMRPCVERDSARGFDPATTRYVTAHGEAWTSETTHALDEIRRRGVLALADSRPSGTAPVVVDGKPARPKGASWCGAHDLFGNVWEWSSDPLVNGQAKAHGGSFRTREFEFRASTTWPADRASDDAGSRAALDVPS